MTALAHCPTIDAPGYPSAIREPSSTPEHTTRQPTRATSRQPAQGSARLGLVELGVLGNKARLILGGVDRAQRRPTGLEHGLHLGGGELGTALLAVIAGLFIGVFLETHGERV